MARPVPAIKDGTLARAGGGGAQAIPQNGNFKPILAAIRKLRYGERMIRQLLACFIAVWAIPANALCIYHGVDNVKTSLSQEFRDSRWVVRAHVVSVDYHWSDEDESWTLYRLKVVKSYKGKLSPRFTFFTGRDSGGFFMDGNLGGPDLDRDYLLFLEPNVWHRSDPPSAKGALWVNYNCGQSKLWIKATDSERAQLLRLSRPQ